MTKESDAVGPKTWTCTLCGNSAEAGDPELLRSMGWELDEGDRDGGGTCAPCVKRNQSTRAAPSRAEPVPPGDPRRRSTGGV